jgi:hypothetical protein
MSLDQMKQAGDLLAQAASALRDKIDQDLQTRAALHRQVDAIEQALAGWTASSAEAALGPQAGWPLASPEEAHAALQAYRKMVQANRPTVECFQAGLNDFISARNQAGSAGSLVRSEGSASDVEKEARRIADVVEEILAPAAYEIGRALQERPLGAGPMKPALPPASQEQLATPFIWQTEEELLAAWKAIGVYLTARNPKLQLRGEEEVLEP